MNKERIFMKRMTKPSIEMGANTIIQNWLAIYGLKNIKAIVLYATLLYR
jgi:hypothetical protein